ncbi:MAG TPA: hypothetical protein VHM48_01325, partial [Candidatus Limnocylindrales bacterium]|nr:hypothetical protein [Candidatus Limnocylindrales bacterium]
VPVAWAVLGPVGAAVSSLVAGFVAGVIAGTGRRAIVAVAFGALPAYWIDLVMMPPSTQEFGGFVQMAAGLAIALLAGLALLGGALGVAGARAEHLDPFRSAHRRMALGVAALATVAGWLWWGVIVAATAPA